MRARPAQIRGDGKAAVATRSTDALGKDAPGIVALGGDGSGIVDTDLAARTAVAAKAADSDGQIHGIGAESDRARNRKSTVASTTTDALGQDAIGIVPGCRDGGVIVDGHCIAEATGGAAAADCHADIDITLATTDADRCGEPEAAVATAAPDRLGVNAGGSDGAGRDMLAGAGHVDQPAIAASPSRASDPNTDRCTVTDGEGQRPRQPAAAASAADALREDAVPVAAGRVDAAVIVEVDGSAVAARTGATANPYAERTAGRGLDLDAEAARRG